MGTRIVIGEDHPMIRRGLISLLRTTDDLHVVTEAATPEGLRAAVREHDPDPVILWSEAEVLVPETLEGLTRPAGRRRGRHLRLPAGCGIVAGSEPGQELAEAGAELLPMRDALTATQGRPSGCSVPGGLP